MMHPLHTTSRPKFFSASYVYTRSAFAIFGADVDHDTKLPLYPLLCVSKNLIQRGCPTLPSPTLEDALGSSPQFDPDRPHFVEAASVPCWNNTAKGSDDGFNPALRFWSAFCEALPEDIAYLKALITPEAPIEKILAGTGIISDDLADQQVDFYCPIAGLVIEIDGSQHDQSAQSQLDSRRDSLLNKANVHTLRISASELADQQKAAKAAEHAVDTVRKRLALHVGAPVRLLKDAETEAQLVRTYEIAIRIQVAIIELMQTGILTADAQSWNIALASDKFTPQEELQRIAHAAVLDVFDILENLAVLANVPFTTPSVSFAADPNAADVVLDVSAFHTWDETDLEHVKEAPRTVVIRTSHDIFRNEFRIDAAEPIEYDTLGADASKADKALRYFLRLLFGHDHFKQGQVGILKRALARKPTLGILPTGSGKSACYQLACMLQPAVSFVVCPILSLMQDQERSMHEHGIDHVARIDSQMVAQDRSRVRSEFGRGMYQVAWVSPERFQDSAFRQQLLEISRTMAFGYAVIDEVHCLSEWGHDFRVSYLLLNRTFQRYCPGATLLGLTATASRDVLKDLKAELGLSSQDIRTVSALSRPELHFHIRRTTLDKRLLDLDAIFDEVADRFSIGKNAAEFFQPKGDATTCGIVFANTKSAGSIGKEVGCEEICDHLRARGIPAQTYHSGRKDDRPKIQQQFMDNEFPIMVATKSFGMGIDKQNVRFTVHANLPWSIESFYQEAGRAGRSSANNDSECYILYVPDNDEERTRKLFSRNTSVEEIHEMQPYLEGDLGTIFFLWNRGFDGIVKECGRILRLYFQLEELRDAHDIAQIDDAAADDADTPSEYRGSQTEKALYKLAVCGIVRDWTRDWNRHVLLVELDAADGGLLDRAEAAVEAYIARHAPGFSISHPLAKHEAYIDIYRGSDATFEDRLAGLLGMLLTWANDNIVFSRRAAIGNMLTLCEAGFTDEQISEYIDGYFKLDTDLAERIERVADDPFDMAAWLDVFYDLSQTEELSFERTLRPDGELSAAAPLADRFRESYSGNIGLEWVSLMGKLLSGAFIQQDVIDQVAFVLNSAQDNDSIDFDEMVEETDALVQLCGKNARAAYENAIVEWNPSTSA